MLHINPAWIYTIISVLIVSLISLVGIFFLSIKEKLLKKMLLILVSFSAGALLGAAFIHLIPEVVKEYGFGLNTSLYLLSGILLFFVLEKIIFWRHCHIPTSTHHPHPFTYLNLVGDSFHNFIDGMIIAGSFLISIPLGISTTIAIILHEIPQEIGEFGVLVYGGFSKGKALFFNFLTAITAILGALLILILNVKVDSMGMFLLPFTAGGFIYIATSDLIPELKKDPGLKHTLIQLISLVLGIGIMLTLGLFGGH